MANQRVDCGVPQATNADILSLPTVNEIGVPVNFSLITHDNAPQQPPRKRRETHPAGMLASQRSIGVALSPHDGKIVK